MPRVKSANDLAGKGGVKCAIYSDAGGGKTLLAATAPRPLVIMVEKTGADSLTTENIKRVYGDQKKITYDVPVIEAHTVEQFDEAVNFVRESKDYDTIIVDSMSELSKIRLKDELPHHKNAMQAYGVLAQEMDDMVREMRDDDKNWVFLFHKGREDTYDEDGEKSGTQYVPDFEGQKMNHDFPYLIGDIYFIDVDPDDESGNPARRLRTAKGDTAYLAKNRRGGLDILEDMHLGKIFWKLKKKKSTRIKKK
tara:strand:- start:1938 stop:2690 length:753 start_codon:yes stop_codon:yes gene_type:complete